MTNRLQMIARRVGGVALALVLAVCPVANCAEIPPHTKTFIQAHCLDCHDADTARAGFRIDLLTADYTAGNNAGLWKEVMDKINSGEMPPKKRQKRPDAKEAFAVSSWIAAQLHETETAAQGAGGRVPMRRMNRAEYANTVRDLFGLDENFARRIENELPADGKVGGFDRGAASLFMDEGQLTQYMAVADLVLDEGVFIDKPRVQKFEYEPRLQKHIHGIGALYKDASGKVLDDNPTPQFVSELKEPLAKIPVAAFNQMNSKEIRYVSHGPFQWTVKNGGIEYLSGGNNYKRDGNLRSPFYAEDWGKKGVKQDGWYRFKVQLGAFVGEGKEAQKEVRFVVEYGSGSPIEVIQNVVVDAPLDKPKEYEFKMYLQAGPPGMNRSWRMGWDNGNKDIVITNPEYWDVQWKPVIIAGQIEKLTRDKNSAEEIAALKKKSEEALAAALENRKTFNGAYWIFDPKVDVAKRPRLWVGKMEFEGPLVDWPTKGYKAILFAGDERNDDAYAREIFAKFLPLAYRRPTSSDELDRIVKWTLDAKTSRGLTFVKAIREGLKNVLCSPTFLYIGSEGDAGVTSEKTSTGPQPVDDWQFASRLSYLLWSSAPDAALYRLASENKLRMPDVLHAQVKRMIADPRAWEFVRSFAGQWLGVRNFANGNPPNRDFYKHYDDALRDSSKREPLEFFNAILQQNQSVTHFIDSDFLMINERLAKHYGIDGVVGEAFRPIAAPADKRRGGVFGMAGIMTYLADGTRTLPVRRATWVLDTMWNQPVPPPPPNAGELPVIKDKKLSVRARLDQHRMSENCASCHTRVDPFGMALENYDATGMWRDRQNGEGMKGDAGSPALDVSGKLSSGAEFKSVQEFKAALLAEKNMFVKGFTEKMLCYALGRPIAFGDNLTVKQIADHAAQHDYRLQEIIQATVSTSFFQTR